MFQGEVSGQKTRDTLSGENRGEAPKHVGLRDQTQPSDMSEEERRSATEGLMERVLDRVNMQKALKRVLANNGAGGVDGMTVDELKPHLVTHWQGIRKRLMNGTYMPSPVRCVEIPKLGVGMRQLGIPTVLDRLIQQAVLQILTPIFDPGFSESSFGFRPRRSAVQAVKKAKEYVAEGHGYVVDIDLENFFNTVNHDIVMGIVRSRIADVRVVKLIRKYLATGVLVGGLTTPTEKGTPQGGPLSPLLSNILLDLLDKELERRGLSFVRYADDGNIYVKSQRAGERVMTSITEFIEKKLKLKVNCNKSAVDRPSKRKFLGFTVGTGGKTSPAKKSIARFVDKVRRITSPTKGLSIEQVFEKLNPLLRGWLNYFGNCDTPSRLRKLGEWVRHRVRMIQWRLWKRSKKRYDELVKLGVKEDTARQTVGSAKGPYRIAQSPALHIGLNLEWFRNNKMPDFICHS
jgi:RNA-directed DNA polymerase